MNYTDHTDNQLKQALAKMLPETVCYEQESLYWQYEEIRYDRPVMNRGNRILDTELLHLCVMVEDRLEPLSEEYYFERISKRFNWQQRVIKLAEVKGIEI